MMADPVVTLHAVGPDEYIARWLTRRYRFMLSDGTTIDVESHQDSSTLRTAVRELVSRELGVELAIVGVADLTPPPVVAKKKAAPRKR